LTAKFIRRPYLRDVLQRLPTQRNSQIEELLPHQWRPQAAEAAAE